VNGATIVAAASTDPIPDATVLVASGRVAYVGPTAQCPPYRAAELLDARGRTVFPGLVNTHTHVAQTLTRCAPSRRRLGDWLMSVALPTASALTPERYETAMLLASAEALRGGTTRLVEYALDHDGVDLYRAALRAADRVGIRVLLARGVSGRGRPGVTPRPLAEKLAETVELRAATDQQVGVALPPVAGMTDADLDLLAEWSAEHDVLLTAHVAEDPSDDAECLEAHGCTVTERLDRAGALTSRMLVAHGVHLSDSDLDRIAESGATVAHNPVSNLYLRAGQAPVRRMRERGIPVALGTDGAASNGTQNLLETMKFFAVGPESSEDTAAGTREALELASDTGARYLEPARAGGIAAGDPADLFVYYPRAAWSTSPWGDPVQSLVQSGATEGVETAVSAGRVVVRDGAVTGVDDAELRDAVERLARELELS
jgi:Cytosine deaminase and related metal-dependent hydrolases